MGAVPPHLAAAHVRVFSGGPGSEGLIKEEPGKSGKKMEGGASQCVYEHTTETLRREKIQRMFSPVT